MPRHSAVAQPIDTVWVTLDFLNYDVQLDVLYQPWWNAWQSMYELARHSCPAEPGSCSVVKRQDDSWEDDMVAWWELACFRPASYLPAEEPFLLPPQIAHPPHCR